MKAPIPIRSLVLFGIVFLAFFLRLYKVDKIPPSLSWDEVSIGYNAYSILQTGRDEHQRFLPLDTFVAYGDYKPPLSIYLTVPAVALFGLNEFALRLPSAIAGMLTVIITYFLVKELFKSFLNSLTTNNLQLITTFLLAISPWHIQLSRAGFEANIALMFIVLGVLGVLIARDKPKLFLISWLPFVAAVYTFNSARYFSPLLIVGLVLFSWEAIRQQKKLVVVGAVIVLVSLLPILPHLLSKEARLRFAEVNIFTDATVVATANDRMAYDGNAWWSKIFHNRRIGYARSYLAHFFDNLEPSFLFIRGDGNPKFSIQDVGQMYLVELPFLLLGIFGTLAKFPRVGWLGLYWLIVAMVPAATARETPHALRIENSLPVWQILIAYGLISNIKNQISKRKKLFLAAVIAVLYAGNFTYYWHNYYNHYAREFSGEWQYGYREALEYVKPQKNLYDRIVITESIGRAYMYTLFYEKYDPRKYWQTVDASFDAAGFYHVAGFDKYQFVTTGVGEWQKNTLYVLKPDEVPSNARLLNTVYQLDGKPKLVIFEI